MKPLSYVYRLTHRETGRFYIGYREANKIPAIEDLPIYKSSSSKVKKLGFTNFDYEIIAEFENGSDSYDLEQQLIEKSKKDLLCLNGHFTKSGKLQYRRVGPHTEETKLKQSLVKRGIKFSDEHKEKLRQAKIGTKRSVKSKEKQGLSTRGKNLSLEHRVKISKGLHMHSLSDETKEKISKSLVGRPLSEETKKKMSIAHKNRIAQMEHATL